jgi:glycosyltransferase involved in cell wall biosynthesis
LHPSAETENSEPANSDHQATNDDWRGFLNLAGRRTTAQQSPPHIVSVVFNAVAGDSRVIKTARAALNKGFDATIIGYSKTAMPSATSVESIPVLLIPNPNLILRCLVRQPRRLHQWDVDLWVQATSELMLQPILRLKPDLLHSHDMYGLAAAALARSAMIAQGRTVPWVHDVHEYVIGCTHLGENFYRTATSIEPRYIREPDVLLTVSDALAAILAERYELPQPPVVTYNTPYRATFDATAPDVRSVFALSGGTPLVVYVGGLGHENRAGGVLAQSLQYLDDVHLCIVTNHENEVTRSLRDQTRALGVSSRLHFHPYVASSQVSSFIRTADVGLFSSARYPNADVSLPNKLFEYLHAGLPVVVADVPETAAFVRRRGIGEVYESENPQSCADAIRRVLNNRGHYARNITPALVAEYSWEAQEAKLGQIYEELLGKAEARNAPAPGIPSPLFRDWPSDLPAHFQRAIRKMPPGEGIWDVWAKLAKSGSLSRVGQKRLFDPPISKIPARIRRRTGAWAKSKLKPLFG